MPESLLVELKKALPNVRFVERFGTSETGALPAGGSGCGLNLRSESDGFEWKVVEGELWVRSPACALGYLGRDNGGFVGEGWFQTGDLAETLPGGAVRILGRRREVINVGGEKVLPGEVENVLNGHPLVGGCRVHSVRNALLGQVVAADVVWRGTEVDGLKVKRVLHEYAASRLPRHKLPIMIRLVDSIAPTGNFKMARPAASA